MEAQTTRNDYPTPVQAAGMRRVGKDEFFAAIGNRDVHPHIVSRYDRATGYIDLWKLQDMSQRVVGVTDGGTHLCQSRYFLPVEA